MVHCHKFRAFSLCWSEYTLLCGLTVTPVDRGIPGSPTHWDNSFVIHACKPLLSRFGSAQQTASGIATIGPAVRADFRRLYPANAKTPTCCPSDDNRTKVTNSVTSARSLWWHVGPYFWPADLTRTANPIGTELQRTIRI